MYLNKCNITQKKGYKRRNSESSQGGIGNKVAINRVWDTEGAGGDVIFFFWQWTIVRRFMYGF